MNISEVESSEFQMVLSEQAVASAVCSLYRENQALGLRVEDVLSLSLALSPLCESPLTFCAPLSHCHSQLLDYFPFSLGEINSPWFIILRTVTTWRN